MSARGLALSTPPDVRSMHLTIQTREWTRSILVSEIVNLTAADTDKDQPESEPQQQF